MTPKYMFIILVSIESSTGGRKRFSQDSEAVSDEFYLCVIRYEEVLAVLSQCEIHDVLGRQISRKLPRERPISMFF